MTAYLVRLADDHQVVGIFVAEDVDELAYLVDQACDPRATEYLELTSGGAYVGGQTAAQWPLRMVSEDCAHPDDEDPLRGASLDDAWLDASINGAWTSLASGR